jgi:hypothetical protein
MIEQIKSDRSNDRANKKLSIIWSIIFYLLDHLIDHFLFARSFARSLFILIDQLLIEFWSITTDRYRSLQRNKKITVKLHPVSQENCVVINLTIGQKYWANFAHKNLISRVIIGNYLRKPNISDLFLDLLFLHNFPVTLDAILKYSQIYYVNCSSQFMID